MSYIKTLLTLLLFFLTLNHSAQNWLQKGGGLANDEAFDVEVDDSGNIYTAGYVSGPITFGPNISLTANGFSDIFLSKSNAQGEFLWVKTFGGSMSDRATDIDIGPDGMVYMTGYYQGTATFGSTTFNSNAGSRDFFIAKIDPSGEIVWVKTEGGSGAEIGSSISFGSDNNIVVTGAFSGNTTIGVTDFVSAFNDEDNEYSKDIFIAKFSFSGVNLWAKQGSSSKNDRGLRVDISDDNDIYISGQISDTLSLGGQTFNNAIQNAGYVAKLDPMGTLIWLNVLGAFEVATYDLEVDADRIYVTGEFLGQMLILTEPTYVLNGNYTYRLFLIRFDTDGQVVWAQEDDSESKISSKSLCIDGNRDVYIAGTFKCRFDEYADDLQEEGLFYSAGYKDIFITKYASSGDRIWYRQYGGPGNDHCAGIAISEVDQPIIAGGFEKKLSVPLSNSNSMDGDITIQNVLMNCEPFTVPYATIISNANIDMFVGKPFQEDAPHYYYFLANSCFDSVLPSISPSVDSVTFCGEGVISALTYTPSNGYYEESLSQFSGPEFEFSWNTGATAASFETETSLLAIVEVTRKDLCYSSIDSIYITINPIPVLPLITDDAGYNSNQPPNYTSISTCGDSVLVQMDYNELLDSLTIYPSSGEQFPYLDGGYYMVDTDTYTVSVENDYGCSNSTNYSFLVLSPIDIPEISPVLLNPDGLDSAVICVGETVPFYIYDQFTNPNLDLDNPYCNAILFPGNSDPICIGTSTSAIQDGWQTVQYDFILGYENICGLDSVEYSTTAEIYLTVNPNPEVNYNVSGDLILCPGDTVNAWTNNLIENFAWSGPGIVSYSEQGDTISVVSEGIYTLSGSVTDTITGCFTSVQQSVAISYPSTPIIWSDAPDNLICPNDSLMLSSPFSQSYAWVGPDGDNLGDTQNIWVSQPGFYYCVIVNNQGCQLTSNTIELLQYNTPFVIVNPLGDLCLTGSVTLTTLVSGQPDIWWDAPINSSQEEVIITTGGVYTVTVEQCNIPFSETIVIDDNSFVAEILASPQTTTCVGDTIMLTANAGMAFYNWSSGETTPSILVTESGNYSVQVISAFGCEGNAPAVSLEFLQDAPPPASIDTTVCTGYDLVLTAPQSLGAIWYDSNNTILNQGLEYEISNITNNLNLQYANILGSCVSEASAINISIIASPDEPIVQLSDQTCIGDTLVLNYLNWTDNQSSWVDYPSTTDSSLEIVLGDATVSITAINTNVAGCISSATTEVDPLPAPLPSFLQYNYPLCTEDTLLLEATNIQSNTTYLWSDPTSNTNPGTVWSYGVVSPNNSGEYICTVTNENGCESKDTITVTINTYPILALGADSNFCFEDEVLILSVPSIYQTYEWSDGSQGNTITIYEPGLYTLEVSNFGCYTLDSITITADDCLEPEFANVFTPNGDGENDYLSFQSPIIKSGAIKIFNRWGKLIYETNDLNNKWNGRHYISGDVIVEGTYFYVMDYFDYNDVTHRKNGSFVLTK